MTTVLVTAFELFDGELKILPGVASMPLQTTRLALEMALSIVLTVEEDRRLEGGATH